MYAGPNRADEKWGTRGGISSLAGFSYIIGWPDQAPSYGPYTDFIASIFNATALVAAIDYRRRVHL